MDPAAPRPDDDAQPRDPSVRWYQFRLSNLLIVVIAINVCVFIYVSMQARVDDMAQEVGASGLALKGGTVDFWIVQRQTLVVPGSRGRAHLSVGDITGGQVSVAMADKTGKPLVSTCSMRPGEAVVFTFLGKRYHLKLLVFENHLFHDDRAQFEIKELGPASGGPR